MWHVLRPLSLYAIVCIAFFPSLRHQISPDTVEYITVAEAMVALDLFHAVNGIRSPLYSLLLTPFVIFDINRIVAVKVLNLLVGACLYPAIYGLASTLKIARPTSELMLYAAVPFIASSAFLIATPDLLTVLVVTVYMDRLLKCRFDAGGLREGAMLGIIGTIGYLAKSYLFPFFLVHIMGTFALARWTGARIGLARRSLITAMAVLVLASSPWIYALHGKYGVWNIATTSYALSGIFSPARGIGVYEAPTMEPQTHLVDPGALSVVPADGTYLVLNNGPLAKYADWSVFDGWQEAWFQLQLTQGAMAKAGYWLVRFSPFLIPLFGYLLIIGIARRRGPDGFLPLFFVWTGVAFLSGYLTVNVEGRFILFLWLLGIVSGCWAMQNARPLKYRRQALYLLIASFAVLPTRWLFVNAGVQQKWADVAHVLRHDLNITGPIASNVRFYETTYVALHMGVKYFGQINLDDPRAVQAELRKHGVRYFLDWRSPGHSGRFSSIGEDLSQNRIPDLTVYRIQ